jgi:hypothetical protein
MTRDTLITLTLRFLLGLTMFGISIPTLRVSFLEKDTTGWLRVVDSGQITLV